MHVHARLGEGLGHQLQRTHVHIAADGLGQDREPLALLGAQRVRVRRPPAVELRQARGCALLRRAAQAIGVVQLEDPSLRHRRRAAARRGMAFVAVELDRAAFVARGHRRHGDAVDLQAGREGDGVTGDPVLLAARSRHDLGLGPAQAAAARDAGEREARAHHLDELATVFLAGLARALGELAVEEAAELRRLLQFLDAAPVGAARGCWGRGRRCGASLAGAAGRLVHGVFGSRCSWCVAPCAFSGGRSSSSRSG